MKSILFLLTRYPAVSGGIEKVTTYISNNLIDRGWEVTILAAYKQNGTEVSSIGLNESIPTYLLPDERTFDSEKNIKFVDSLIKERGIELIILQDSYSGVHRLLLHLENAPKIIVAEHNIPTALLVDKVAEFKEEKILDIRSFIRKICFPLLYIKNLIQIKKHHRVVYDLADKYVVLSSGYKPIVEKLIGHKDSINKITTIHNPITVNYDMPISCNKSKECLFVGRLNSQKGVDFLLDIWKLFSIKHNDWVLRVVGDGPLDSKIKQRIKKEKIINVILEGRQTDVERYYAKASIVCMTSRFEGWGLVLVEGMKFGCVPVAFNSYAAVKDIIEDEKNGFIIPAYDIEKYAYRLSQLADNPNVLSAMKKLSLIKVKEYEITHIIDEWENLLENI